jgi:heme exporter protein B
VSAVLALLRRDLALMLHGQWLLPVLFFLAVAMLFPFAVGSDPALLARSGGGVIWVAALLASLLPIERLLAPDRDLGVIDQLALRGIGEETVVAVRALAHWLAFAPALMLAALPAAALLGLSGETLMRLEWGLLLGTPGLAALGVLVAAVTAGLGGGTVLAGLLALPLAVPLLIFGAGSLSGASGPGGGLALTAAASLLLIAIAPFAGGAALRSGR